MKNNDLRKTIADNLRRLRESHGLSQTDLGKELGKEKTTISTWERGVSMPDIVTLYKLSKRYDVDINTFYLEPEAEKVEDRIVMLGDTFLVKPKPRKAKLKSKVMVSKKAGKPQLAPHPTKPAKVSDKYRVAIRNPGTAEA